MSINRVFVPKSYPISICASLVFWDKTSGRDAVDGHFYVLRAQNY